MAVEDGGPMDGLALREAVVASVEKANAGLGSRVLAVGLGLTDCDPLAGFALGEAEDRFFWEQAARGHSIAGRGAVVAVEAEARGALEVDDLPPAARPIARVGAALVEGFRDFDCVGGAEPLFVGGFGFDGTQPGPGDWERFAAGRLVVPELLLR